MAWQTEALARQKRLPSLSALLTRSAGQTKVQTVAQQRTALHMLSEIYGGKVVPGKAKPKSSAKRKSQT